MHHKVIDYYNFVLENLTPPDDERSRIVGYILREEKRWRILRNLGAGYGAGDKYGRHGAIQEPCSRLNGCLNNVVAFFRSHLTS